MGAQFPPVVVFYDGKSHCLADEFHRLGAAKSLGWDKIAADVRQGTRRDAVLFSVGANGLHRHRRMNEDKRRAVMALLADAEWGKWADREIARQCGVDHKTVAALWPTLSGEFPQIAEPRTVTRGVPNASRRLLKSRAVTSNFASRSVTR